MHKFEEYLAHEKRPAAFAAEYGNYLGKLVSSMDYETLAGIVQTLDSARLQKKKIFICGNGGSAATASHIAEDLALGPKKRGHAAFRTVALTDNVSNITAIGNDEGYDLVFVRQLENLFEPGDIVVGISASGNSPNVIKALEYANANGGISVALTGFDGGQMRKIANQCLHVASGPGEYEPIEDAHLIIGHMVASYFKYQPCNS
jgi:D-sedoheptulose 7-phosphate isomerase